MAFELVDVSYANSIYSFRIILTGLGICYTYMIFVMAKRLSGIGELIMILENIAIELGKFVVAFAMIFVMFICLMQILGTEVATEE